VNASLNEGNKLTDPAESGCDDESPDTIAAVRCGQIK